MARAVLLANALTLIASILSPELSVAAGGEVVDCTALATRLSGHAAALVGANVSVEGATSRVEAEAAPHQIVVCGSPGPTVLCMTEAAEERQIGDIVVVSGQVSEATVDFIRIERCIHRGR